MTTQTPARRPSANRAVPRKAFLKPQVPSATPTAPAASPRKKPVALPKASSEASLAATAVKSVKPAKPAKPAKPVNSVKPAKPGTEPKPDTPAKPPKQRSKPVRDSFTMPPADFALIATLKARTSANGRETKKSELLRAGLHVLAALEVPALLAALGTLAPVKVGRPKSGR